MDQPFDHTVDNRRRLLMGAPMMVVAILIVLVGVPMAFVMSGHFSAALESAGVHLSPNIDDGRIISEFEDAAADLLKRYRVRKHDVTQ